MKIGSMLLLTITMPLAEPEQHLASRMKILGDGVAMMMPQSLSMRTHML